jgi:hypothetical protein
LQGTSKSLCLIYERSLTFIPLQKFYAALFPSWEWKPATDKFPDEKIALWSFAGKTGMFLVFLLPIDPSFFYEYGMWNEFR